MRKLLLLITILMLTLVPMSLAGVGDKAGTSGADFLKIVSGARPSGLGGTFVAVADDLNAVNWNPAGLTSFRGQALATNYGAWFEDADFGSLTYGFPISAERSRYFCADFSYFRYGMMKRITSLDVYGLPIEQGQFGASDSAFTVAYAQTMDDNLTDRGQISMGIAAKLIHREIDGMGADAIGADFGVILQPSRALKFGLSVQNVGGEVAFEKESDPLPLTTRLGASYQLPFVNNSHRAFIAMDMIKCIDSPYRVATGVEYWFKDMFSLRAGYKTNSDASDLGVGASCRFKGYQLDYAFTPLRLFGSVHRISVVIFWGTRHK
jgi:hypothetical protein